MPRIAAILVAAALAHACASSSGEKTDAGTGCLEDADCPVSQVCIGTVCVVARICTPDDLSCDGATVVRCNAAGSALDAVVSCEHGCAGGACRSCECSSNGALRCDPSDPMLREQCDGCFWQATDICSIGCEAGACITACDCLHDRCKLDGTAMLLCSQSPCGETEEACGAGRHCEATASGLGEDVHCVAGLCQAGARSCDGKDVLQCVADGSGTLFVETCAEACEAGACVPCECTDGAKRCHPTDAQQLQECVGCRWTRASFCAFGRCHALSTGPQCVDSCPCDNFTARCTTDGLSLVTCADCGLGSQPCGPGRHCRNVPGGTPAAECADDAP